MLDKIEKIVEYLKHNLAWNKDRVNFGRAIGEANSCLKAVMTIEGENDRVCTVINDLMVIIPSLNESLNAELKKELRLAEVNLLMRETTGKHAIYVEAAKKHNLHLVDIKLADVTSKEMKGFPRFTEEQWANKRKALLTVVKILEEPSPTA